MKLHKITDNMNIKEVRLFRVAKVTSEKFDDSKRPDFINLTLVWIDIRMKFYYF